MSEQQPMVRSGLEKLMHLIQLSYWYGNRMKRSLFTLG